MVRITSLHISCIQKWSGTEYIMYKLLRTASLHIYCVLKWSGTNANECGFSRTTPSYTSWGTGKYFRMYNKTVRNELYMIYQNLFLNK